MERRLGELDLELAQVDTQYGRSNVLSDRRLDESDRVGIRAYIVASRYITIARENHNLLVSSVSGEHGRVFPHATSNLVRPAFEAGAWALWILDGADGATRRLRGLRCEVADHKQGDAFVEELQPLRNKMGSEEAWVKHEEKRAWAAKRYREDADHIGIEWRKVAQKPNLLDELDRLSPFRESALLRALARAGWRRLSGIQHAHSYAGLASTERLQSVPIPGGQRTLVTVSDEALVMDWQTAGLMELLAMQRYIDLTTRLTAR